MSKKETAKDKIESIKESYEETVNYMGRCYNILAMDPLNADKTGTPDNKIKNIFNWRHESIYDYKNKHNLPPGIKEQQLSGSILDEKMTKIFTSTEAESSFAVGVKVDVKVEDVAFTHSTRYEELRKNTFDKDNVCFFSKAETNKYSLEIDFNKKSEELKAKLYLDSTFEKEVAQLPKDAKEPGCEDKYKNFIKSFGTHYAKYVTFGGRLFVWQTMTKENYTEMISKSLSTDTGIKAMVPKKGGAGVNVTTENKDVQELTNKFEQKDDLIETIGGDSIRNMESYDDWVSSLNSSPRAICINELQFIYEILTPTFFPNDKDIPAKSQLMKQFVDKYIDENRVKPEEYVPVTKFKIPSLKCNDIVYLYSGSIANKKYIGEFEASKGLTAYPRHELNRPRVPLRLVEGNRHYNRTTIERTIKLAGSSYQEPEPDPAVYTKNFKPVSRDQLKDGDIIQIESTEFMGDEKGNNAKHIVAQHDETVLGAWKDAYYLYYSVSYKESLTRQQWKIKKYSEQGETQQGSTLNYGDRVYFYNEYYKHNLAPYGGNYPYLTTKESPLEPWTIERSEFYTITCVDNKKPENVLTIIGEYGPDDRRVAPMLFYGINYQYWRFQFAKEGYYYIFNFCGRCLQANPTEQNAVIVLPHKEGDENQMWKFLDAGNDSYYIVNRQTYKYLDLVEGKIQLSLQSDPNKNSQKWKFD